MRLLPLLLCSFFVVHGLFAQSPEATEPGSQVPESVPQVSEETKQAGIDQFKKEVMFLVDSSLACFDTVERLLEEGKDPKQVSLNNRNEFMRLGNAINQRLISFQAEAIQLDLTEKNYDLAQFQVMSLLSRLRKREAEVYKLGFRMVEP